MPITITQQNDSNYLINNSNREEENKPLLSNIKDRFPTTQEAAASSPKQVTATPPTLTSYGTFFLQHKILYYPNGKIKYEGGFANGKPHGNGILYHTNGQMKYKGAFVNGDQHGKGTYFYLNNDRYEGESANNKANGKGTIFFDNGDRYEGEFVNDQAHGKGTLFYQNGDRYEGEFVHNRRHGTGIVYKSAGDFSVTYHLGVLKESAKRSRG